MGSGISTQCNQKITIRKNLKVSQTKAWGELLPPPWNDEVTFYFQLLIDVLLIKARSCWRPGGAVFLRAISLRAWIAAKLQEWTPDLFMLHQRSSLGSCRKVHFLEDKFCIAWKTEQLKLFQLIHTYKTVTVSLFWQRFVFALSYWITETGLGSVFYSLHAAVL